MKKILSLVLLLISVTFISFGCTPVDQTAKDGDYIVITVSGEIAEDLTLAQYMEQIKGGESLSSFVMEGGMITEINGLKASGNVYWMLFTDDSENSNADWGTVTVNEKIYPSASLGAESLIIKSGYTYIWYAQAF